MLLMFKQGIRGGVAMICRVRANNKYTGVAFDRSNSYTYIQYLDANNLYGWAMSKPLPTSGFKV